MLVHSIILSWLEAGEQNGMEKKKKKAGVREPYEPSRILNVG